MLFHYNLGRPQRHPLPRPLPYTPAHLVRPGFRRATAVLGWPHALLAAGTTSGVSHHASLMPEPSGPQGLACIRLKTTYSPGNRS
jgi:hypothetical protein